MTKKVAFLYKIKQLAKSFNKKSTVFSASVIGIITDALVIFAYRQVILLSQLYFATQSYIYP
jgi:hypothetical protein